MQLFYTLILHDHSVLNSPCIILCHQSCSWWIETYVKSVLINGPYITLHKAAMWLFVDHTHGFNTRMAAIP